MMLDVSRHFFDVNFVKKQIDAFAYYKLNRLHLHLTDAAGWRIEIDKYPRLTEFAAWREFPTWKEWWNNGRQYSEEGSKNAYGGYYTKRISVIGSLCRISLYNYHSRNRNAGTFGRSIDCLSRTVLYT